MELIMVELSMMVGIDCSQLSSDSPYKYKPSQVLKTSVQLPVTPLSH